MNRSKFKFNRNRIIAMVILFITIALICFFYGDTYHLTSDKNTLEEAVNDYISASNVKAEVKLIQKENGWLYVMFTDSQYESSFKGMARLKRGFNGKYVIYDADYGPGYPVSLYLFRNDNHKSAFYGWVPDGRAVRYEYVKTGSSTGRQVEYSGEIPGKAFVKVCDKVKNTFMELHLYDAANNDITDSYISSINNGAPNAGVSTAELFVTDYACGFLLLVGSLFAIVCWRKRNTKMAGSSQIE